MNTSCAIAAPLSQHGSKNRPQYPEPNLRPPYLPPGRRFVIVMRPQASSNPTMTGHRRSQIHGLEFTTETAHRYVPVPAGDEISPLPHAFRVERLRFVLGDVKSMTLRWVIRLGWCAH